MFGMVGDKNGSMMEKHGRKPKLVEWGQKANQMQRNEMKCKNVVDSAKCYKVSSSKMRRENL